MVMQLPVFVNTTDVRANHTSYGLSLRVGEDHAPSATTTDMQQAGSGVCQIVFPNHRRVYRDVHYLRPFAASASHSPGPLDCSKIAFDFHHTTRDQMSIGSTIFRKRVQKLHQLRFNQYRQV